MIEFIFACIGAIVCIIVAISLLVFVISYVRTIHHRFTARKFYYMGREHERTNTPDYFAKQKRPSFKL